MVWPLPQDGPRFFYRTGSLGDYFSTSIEQAPSVPGSHGTRPSHLTNFIEIAKKEGIDLRPRLLIAKALLSKFEVPHSLSLVESDPVVQI